MQHTHKRLGCSLDTLSLIHTVDDLLFQEQVLDITEEIRMVLFMKVSNDKTADGQSLGDNLHQILDTVRLTSVVLRDHTTGDDPSKSVHIVQRGLEGLATNIFKVNVDSFGCQLLERLTDRAFLVVEGVMES